MKKILIMGVVILMLISLSSCKNDYTYKEGDLRFTITVNNINTKAGDTIEVIAKLENLSNQNIYMKMVHTDYKELSDMILIGIFNENSDYAFISNLKGGPLSTIVFKKNGKIEKKVRIEVEKNQSDVVAFISFNYGENYEQNIYMYSNVVKLNIL